ncbi:hypothetical protein BCR32DRAFT_302614 [Anaeromyces robustus]|uniref:Uncharacterized protein n=1 Tax=Anaeromyces robustus TaxID=1754192 RepID=A0A1Y1WV35_9FUNG|nr:hypothetical protein BCR32DRAFT_302614 [Anaeromyces robustus]|eukprot:ORX77410.1 hypothetical protein BCR32DRAFT_302614 [Anaeromyces robustus]
MVKINQENILKELQILRGRLNTVDLKECIETLELLTKSLSILKGNNLLTDDSSPDEWNDCKIKYNLGKQFVDIIRIYSERVSILMNEKSECKDEENTRKEIINETDKEIDNIINILTSSTSASTSLSNQSSIKNKDELPSCSNSHQCHEITHNNSSKLEEENIFKVVIDKTTSNNNIDYDSDINDDFMNEYDSDFNEDFSSSDEDNDKDKDSDGDSDN